jgi:chaperonin GroEL (HSP60 family)
MLKAGIIDPTKARVALKTASVAGMISTECALIDIKEEKQVNSMGGGMPGMM